MPHENYEGEFHMRRKTIFYKMVIGALLLSILSGCGKKAGVDYIQENDSRQDAVSASTYI